MDNNNIEIIVARFNENLNWLNEDPFNQFQYTVYNKGNNDNFEKKNVNKIINLPNVGRCDHTYLYHIYNNFDNLANITIFFPGSIHLPNKKGKAIEILNRIKNNNYQHAIYIAQYTSNLKEKFKDFQLDCWQSSESNNSNLYPDTKLYPAIIRPYGKWFKYHFGNLLIKHYSINGIFSLDKRDIIQKSKSKYKSKLKYKYLLNQLRLHANPEVGHYIERSWSAIFFPLQYTKILLL